MNPFFYRLLFIFLWIFLANTLLLFSAEAATYYVDPIHGDNKNSGSSSHSAWRTPMETEADDQIIVIGQTSTQQNTTTTGLISIQSSEAKGLQVYAVDELNQIILGSRTIDEWTAYTNAETVFQATLTLSDEQNIESVFLGNQALEETCAIDFLNHSSWAWGSNVLYIQSPDGNPDVIDQTVTVTLFDASTGEYPERTLTEWAQASVYVWQADLTRQPVDLFLNGETYEDWWWGEDQCGSLADTLYMRSDSGSPAAEGSVISAAMEEGGWAITSGDFNGDGLIDIATSDFGPYIYLNYGAETFSPMANSILAIPGSEEVFGFRVAAVGDVNGDGFGDLLTGMNWGDNNVYLFYGSAQGLSANNHQVITPPEGYASYGLGHGLAGAGDVNKDGYADIVVAGGGAYVGVYLGSSQGIAEQPDSILSFSNSLEDEIINLAGLGDVNGDGFDDIVASPSRTNVTSLTAQIYYGSAQGIVDPSDQSLTVAIDRDEVTKGLSVGNIGDVNNDGYNDLLMADPFATGDMTGEGTAYLYYGSADGFADSPDLIIYNPEPEENVRFGTAFTGIEDFDGDGIDDVAIGTPYAGKTFVFLGSSIGLVSDTYLAIEGADEMGWSVAPVGDLNGAGQNYFATGQEFGVGYLYALKEGQVLPTKSVDNLRPSANAGSDQKVEEGTTVYLDGTASKDTDDGIASWHWTQTSGPEVVLSNNFCSNPYFLTPPVTAEGETIEFDLTVTDHRDSQNDAQVTIKVTDNGITGFPDNAITIASSDGKALGFEVKQGGTLMAIEVVDPTTFIGHSNWNNGFLYDLVSLKIKTIETAGNVLLTCYFQDSIKANTNVIQYTPTYGWRNIGNQTNLNSDGTELSITQSDGVLGDEDLKANGTVSLNHFGVTTSSDLPPTPSSVSSSSSSHSSGDSSGCFLGGLMHQ